MDSTADLDFLFADSDATMAVGVGIPFPVIFNEAGQEVQLFEGSVMSTGPQAVVKSSDIGTNSIDNDMSVTVTSPSMGLFAVAYVVTSVQPDGLGLSLITLMKG